MNRTNTPPLVSIIIPCYNQGQYIEDALNSVLQSTYKNVEIIIVDDGSTARLTKKIIQTLKDKQIIIKQKNYGLSIARNNGIKVSKGKYFLPLDADDYIDTTYIEKAVSILESNPKIGFVYSNVRFFGDVNYVWETNQISLITMRLFNSVTSSAIIRRNAYNQTAGYNPNMIYGYEDWDFYLSLLEIGWQAYFIHEPLLYYRKHGKTMNQIALHNYNYLYLQIKKNHYKIFSHPSFYITFFIYKIYILLRKFIPHRLRIFMKKIIK